MAFVSQGWVLTLTFRDTGNNPTTRDFHLQATDDAGDLSPVIAAVQDIMTAYVAATDAVITQQRLTKVTVEDSVTLPAGNVNVEDNAHVTAVIDGAPNKSAWFEIPAPKNSCFIAPTGDGHNIVKFDSPSPVGAVVNLFKTGAQSFISDGEVITDQGIKGVRTKHKAVKG